MDRRLPMDPQMDGPKTPCGDTDGQNAHDGDTDRPKTPNGENYDSYVSDCHESRFRSLNSKYTYTGHHVSSMCSLQMTRFYRTLLCL